MHFIRCMRDRASEPGLICLLNALKPGLIYTLLNNRPYFLTENSNFVSEGLFVTYFGMFCQKKAASDSQDFVS